MKKKKKKKKTSFRSMEEVWEINVLVLSYKIFSYPFSISISFSPKIMSAK